MHGHPVVVRPERPKRKELLAAEHVDEEIDRLVEVRHRDPDVLGAAQAGQSAPCPPWLPPFPKQASPPRARFIGSD